MKYGSLLRVMKHQEDNNGIKRKNNYMNGRNCENEGIFSRLKTPSASQTVITVAEHSERPEVMLKKNAIRMV